MYTLCAAIRESIATRLQGVRLPAAPIIICLSAVVFTASLQAATIYKSVDSNGNIIFTDQPIENAESIGDKPKKTPKKATDQRVSESGGPPVHPDDAFEPPDAAVPLLVAPAPLNPPKQDTSAFDEPADIPFVTRVEILTPEHDTSLLDPLGQIWIEVQSYPQPMSKTGLIAELWMDEEFVTSARGTVLRLPPPARGTHVLRVKLVDSKGQLYRESVATHIHVRYSATDR